MPTILPMLRFWIIILACVVTCITAQPNAVDEGSRVGKAFVRLAGYFAHLTDAAIVTAESSGLFTEHASRCSSASQGQFQAPGLAKQRFIPSEYSGSY